MALSGLYIDTGTQCTHQLLLAKQGDFVAILSPKQSLTVVKPKAKKLHNYFRQSIENRCNWANEISFPDLHAVYRQNVR